MSTTVDIPQSVKDTLRAFRFAKQNAGNKALVFKVNKQTLAIEKHGEQLNGISIGDLVEELPEHAPRFIVLSYERKYEDGRKAFPLLLVNWNPQTAEPGLLTLHASAFLGFDSEVQAKQTIEARDPGVLTKEFVDEKLSGR